MIRIIGEFPTINAKERVNRILAKQMIRLGPLRHVLLKIAAGGDEEENREEGNALLIILYESYNDIKHSPYSSCTLFPTCIR